VSVKAIEPDRRRRPVLIWLGSGVLALAGAVALAAAPSAAAKGDPLKGVETVVKPSSGIAKALSGAGVKLKPKGKAEGVKSGVSFPISGGKLVSGTAEGKVKHAGALQLKKGGTAVSLRKPKVKISDKKQELTAKVGENGPRIKVFKIATGKAKVSRDGFDTKISNAGLKFSSVAAKALNGAFSLGLTKGVKFGKATIKASPKSVQIESQGDTTLALDAGAAAALTSLGITPSPIGPATAESDGIAFPIRGGRLETAHLSGDITHSGGLRLAQNGTPVDLTEFTINLDADPDLTADVGGTRVSILSLDLSDAVIEIDGLSVKVSGVKASLTAAAASALNGAFGTSAFTEGLLLGTATVDATAR